VQARYDRAAITGRLAVNLRGARPAYRFTGKVKGLNWQPGRLDAEGQMETSGTGEQILANLTSEGVFTGAALDFGSPSALRGVSGTYTFAWRRSGPRWHLTGLNLRVEDETYTGSGATQDDGRLLVVLTSGTREMRVTGPTAKLKIEEPARP
jgi:hypothetical protein